MNTKAVTSVTIAIVITIIIASVGAGTYIAYDKGYLPYDPLLPIITPAGDTTRCDINGAGCVLCLAWLDIICIQVNIKNEVKYGLFTTDASSDDVMAEYKATLTDMGYQIYCDDNGCLEGEFTIGMSVVAYAFYVEGITGVGILTTQIGELETCVLFMIGFVGNFESIYDLLDLD